MNEQPLASRGDDDRVFQKVMANFVPAYIRRARGVQEAFDALIAQCRRQREEWLMMATIRLGTLRGLAGSWERLRPWLANPEPIRVLETLWDELNPRLEIRIEQTTSDRKLRLVLSVLVTDLEEFNRRWSAFVPTVDLTHVNQLREGYNLFYVLEKECAVRSHAIARQGFHPLPPATPAEIFARLPLLPVPLLRA